MLNQSTSTPPPLSKLRANVCFKTTAQQRTFKLSQNLALGTINAGENMRNHLNTAQAQSQHISVKVQMVR